MTRRAVLLFARSPEREAAAKGIGSAERLFRDVVRSWLAAAADCGADSLIACEGRDRESLASIAPGISRGWIEQGDGAFALRVAAAASEAFALGYAQVVIAAIDAPPPDLDSVFEAMDRGMTVVAPSRDGGINFIALAENDPELLAEFHPRRRDLVALCRARIRELVVLEAATDIDSSGALACARREGAWRGFFASPIVRWWVVAELVSFRGVFTPMTIRPPPLMGFSVG